MGGQIFHIGFPPLMSSPRLLVVEGNTAEGRAKQVAHGGTVTSDRTQRLLHELLPGADVDICYPADPGTALPGGAALEGYDGIAITGSSLHVYDGGPAVLRQLELADALLNSGTPIFGSCWGLQLLNHAAGGSVRQNPKGREVAIARNVRLTEAGRAHPMFTGKDDVFDAPAVHLDEIETLAPCATLLASNALSKVQAVEIRRHDTVAWAVQYHPEYSLAEIAAIVRRGAKHFIDEGFFRDQADAIAYAVDLDMLQVDPHNKVLAFRYGIDGNILDRKLRLAELSNWLQHLVLPTRSRRGRE
jgi:GMP synthase (glutamine-hydrolysing)